MMPGNDLEKKRKIVELHYNFDNICAVSFGQQHGVWSSFPSDFRKWVALYAHVDL